MTAATVQAPVRPRGSRGLLPAPARLLRLELRRSVMPWMLPVLGALFWLITYRTAMSDPPLWNMRGGMLQANTMLGFAPLLAGVAAWAGSREGRRGIADQLDVTGLPRWAGRLAAWAALTVWAEAAYLAGVAVVYGITARQAVWGGPLWWPVAVGAATAAAACAVGFAAGALLPSRFTAPLAAVIVFLALGAGAFLLQRGARATYSQIWPLNVEGPFPKDSFGIFYPFLPDLSIAQVMFVGGLGIAALGALGLPAVSGGRMLRATAAAITIAGLAATGTAVGLAGTARLEASGIVIPALHDAASDRPASYTPVCSSGGVQVCLHPAYRPYLPEVTAALTPLLNELAGLPGAPTRAIQVVATSVQEGPSNGASFGSPVISKGVLYLPLSGISLPGEGATPAEFVSAVQNTLLPLTTSYTGFSPGDLTRSGGISQSAGQGAAAQFVVAQALAKAAGLMQGSPSSGPGGTRCQVNGPAASGCAPPATGTGAGAGAYQSAAQAQAAATRRFLALPAASRHEWLLTHLSALRAGHITLSEIP
jgi:hypothetical protein